MLMHYAIKSKCLTEYCRRATNHDMNKAYAIKGFVHNWFYDMLAIHIWYYLTWTSSKPIFIS